MTGSLAPRASRDQSEPRGPESVTAPLRLLQEARRPRVGAGRNRSVTREGGARRPAPPGRPIRGRRGTPGGPAARGRGSLRPCSPPAGAPRSGCWASARGFSAAAGAGRAGGGACGYFRRRRAGPGARRPDLDAVSDPARSGPAGCPRAGRGAPGGHGTLGGDESGVEAGGSGASRTWVPQLTRACLLRRKGRALSPCRCPGGKLRLCRKAVPSAQGRAAERPSRAHTVLFPLLQQPWRTRLGAPSARGCSDKAAPSLFPSPNCSPGGQWWGPTCQTSFCGCLARKGPVLGRGAGMPHGHGQGRAAWRPLPW